MAAKFERRNAIAYRALRRRGSLGASMTEYALLLVAVLIIATGVFRTLTKSTNCNGLMSVGELPGNEETEGCGSALASTAGVSDLGGAVNDYTGGSSTSSSGSSTGASGTSGSASSGSSSGSNSGGSATGGSGSSGSASASGSSDGSGSDGSVASSANNGPSFASQVAGTSPKALDLTFAKLANDTYNKKPTKWFWQTGADDPKGADGFTPVSSADLAAKGITPDMLSDKKSGYLAVVYTDGKGHYVIAYRGTDNLAGWGTDIEQGTGHKSTQYSKALQLAKAASAAWPGNVVAVGHSLGGGEAAAVAAATGIPAVTFNAAGVNDQTLKDEGKDPQTARNDANKGQVRNYEVQGELLSTAQNELSAVAPQALGRVIVVQDPHPLKSALMNGLPAGGLVNSKGLHGEYLPGMEQNPVIYKDANGKPATYSFTSNPNPS